MNYTNVLASREVVNVVNIESTCGDSANHRCTGDTVYQSGGQRSSCSTFSNKENLVKIITIPRVKPTGTVFHPGFMQYVAINEDGLKAFLKAIAVNAVGQAFTLAALGIKVKAMRMPNMSIEPRCSLDLPENAWVNNMGWLHNEKSRQARYLEMICWQISGAVAEFAFDESDFYGDLGLGDIEDSYPLLTGYESSHGVSQGHILTGCTVVVERLFAQHYEQAIGMASHLVTRGALNQQEIRRYLSGVRKENLGKQVLATFLEPWMEDETERIHRMFIGS